MEEEKNDKNKKFAPRQNKAQKYVGQKEDEAWWKSVEIDPEKAKQQTDKQIYRILVQNMGVFRWQSAQLNYTQFTNFI